MNKKIFIGYIISDNKRKEIIMETLQKTCLVITIIGAINWLLVGVLDFDLVAFLFGTMSLLTRVVYTLVGVAGLINIGILFNHIEEK
jgi:uncharacterized membrane protein YuzA (DUF378 family)